MSQIQRAGRSAITVACYACRRRRSRCDGARPLCGACEIRGTACEYASAQPTETNAQALKRKYADVESRLAIYTDLYATLQQLELPEALQALSLIRTGADPSAVLRQTKPVAQSPNATTKPGLFRYQFPFTDLLPEALQNPSHNPYLDSLLWHGTIGGTPPVPQDVLDGEISTQHIYLLPYHAAKLVEPHFEGIKASDWTIVTRDDDVVHSLLEIYFLFEYPFFTFFAKDDFLHDMQAGGGPFCSHALVNAILACATHGQQKDLNRADHWLPESLGYQFEAEAKRLWEIDSITPTLTTVQAALIIVATCNINGEDRVGWRYLSRAVEIAKAIGLFKTDWNTSKDAWTNSARVTAWCVFAWQGTSAFLFYRPPLLVDPPTEMLPSESEVARFTGELWVQYPLASSPVRKHIGPTTRALLRFRQLLNEISLAVFRSEESPNALSLQQALGFRSKLNVWMEELPTPLQSEFMAFPCHLKLHLHYHYAIIMLFAPFATVYQERSVSPSLSEDSVRSEDHYLQIYLSAKLCMEALVRLYYSRHGFESWDSMMLLFLSSVAFNSIATLAVSDEISWEERRAILSTIILCVKGVHDQGKNTFVGQAISHVLRHAMSEEDRHLLTEFAGIEHEEERANLISRYVHSSWPIQNANISEDAAKFYIDSMVKAAAATVKETT